MNPGFYKFIDNELLYAPNNVFGPGYDLAALSKDDYTYPVDGWYWFDTEEEAINALSV